MEFCNRFHADVVGLHHRKPPLLIEIAKFTLRILDHLLWPARIRSTAFFDSRLLLEAWMVAFIHARPGSDGNRTGHLYCCRHNFGVPHSPILTYTSHTHT